MASRIFLRLRLPLSSTMTQVPGPRPVAGGDGQPGIVQPARDRLALDDEFHFEAGQQDLIEHPDDQFVLTDGETPHRVNSPWYTSGCIRGARRAPRAVQPCLWTWGLSPTADYTPRIRFGSLSGFQKQPWRCRVPP
jgi:hypothetical protein